ncbi:amino-acid N-acetyltransferase [Pseudoduganella sp. SL102]|uniref:Amino-acid acetyltransferase n=1 Tax=Pseudoduganella albidiflava TaxID=321983 RepID=A0A411WTZ5_9BURK|nr:MULTISPECIES: amino-acid N-acetyltransferase [Pseudoduganella]QBI00255.1 amino-acid N-acetyltransferase [Pseudoduganella albidiflava]WBS01707.1 amino-acid N-acetyltransferase [Pseudoduganella sp. SL102]GGY52479.1 amino-acid acetyltransferase [Pseudoduganella albidiflava]
MENPVEFVQWLRSVAPYIHAFRGKTFVVAFPGELVAAGALPVLAHDLSLLHALGIKVVVVYGSRPQVAEQLALRNVEGRFHNGIRVTDTAAMECAKEAAGELRLDIEAAFSQGLPNTPMSNAAIRVISGNFVTARPLGVIDGVDLELTGVTRKVDAETIHSILAAGGVILLSPLGFSPTGEAFNLTMEDVAVSAAVALHADKLIFITETEMLRDLAGTEIRELSSHMAEAVLQANFLSPESAFYLRHCVKACNSGVERSHIVPFAMDGSAMLELFTHDGVGTMISHENLESLRPATIEDVGGIIKLIEPLEADGTLVKRGRELIEREINYFSVIEHDGVIFGCAALYPFPEEKMAEMACLTVNPEVQAQGDGERILKHMENRARASGITRLFVLTTRTAHWFIKRGFVPATVDALPKDRQRMYNYQRKSQVLVKTL